jgi:hypothetical protein
MVSVIQNLKESPYGISWNYGTPHTSLFVLGNCAWALD